MFFCCVGRQDICSHLQSFARQNQLQNPKPSTMGDQKPDENLFKHSCVMFLLSETMAMVSSEYFAICEIMVLLKLPFITLILLFYFFQEELNLAINVFLSSSKMIQTTSEASLKCPNKHVVVDAQRLNHLGQGGARYFAMFILLYRSYQQQPVLSGKSGQMQLSVLLSYF